MSCIFYITSALYEVWSILVAQYVTSQYFATLAYFRDKTSVEMMYPSIY